MKLFDILDTALDLHTLYEERQEEKERAARKPAGSLEERLAAGLEALRAEQAGGGASTAPSDDDVPAPPPARRTFGRKGLAT